MTAIKTDNKKNGILAKTVNGFVLYYEKIACVILVLWCLLPVFMGIYDLIAGASGAFPTQDELPVGARLGSIVYNKALDTYYNAFCVLGAITLVYALLSIALNATGIFSKINLFKQTWFYIFAALLVWAVLSTTFADDPLYAFKGSDYKHDGLLSYLFYAAV